ncbi:ABC transporter permease subunit [Shewanella putrefaciens]|uniref:ABC transporter permease subunit n=1 Tax=Shewanella putrefaciens TaxID=24 RepID=UPI0035698191
MLFTIFAIIFSFDAITAEKAGKTLSLVCAYSVSRMTIIVNAVISRQTSSH